MMKTINIKNTNFNVKKVLTFSTTMVLLTVSSMSMDTLADRLAKPITGMKFDDQALLDELNALGSSVEIDDLSQSDLDLADLEAELDRQEAMEKEQEKIDTRKNKEQQQTNKPQALVVANQYHGSNFLSNLYSFVTGYITSWFY